jgi:hypothetical protein
MTTTEARQKMVSHMARWDFTPAMCDKWSADQLLFLAAVTVQHQRNLGLGVDADKIIALGEMEKLTAELRQMQ